MKRLAAVTMAMLVSAGPAVPLLAGERGPVCRERSVVEEIIREIHGRTYYSKVNPGLVTEQPTADPHVVRCQVCVQSAAYDTMRFGDRPNEQCVAHAFDVEIFPTGFVVHDLG
jgi:hypothetical protein